MQAISKQAQHIPAQQPLAPGPPAASSARAMSSAGTPHTRRCPRPASSASYCTALSGVTCGGAVTDARMCASQQQASSACDCRGSRTHAFAGIHTLQHTAREQHALQHTARNQHALQHEAGEQHALQRTSRRRSDSTGILAPGTNAHASGLSGSGAHRQLAQQAAARPGEAGQQGACVSLEDGATATQASRRSGCYPWRHARTQLQTQQATWLLLAAQCEAGMTQGTAHSLLAQQLGQRVAVLVDGHATKRHLQLGQADRCHRAPCLDRLALRALAQQPQHVRLRCRGPGRQ